jgi:hypothetical protein
LIFGSGLDSSWRRKMVSRKVSSGAVAEAEVDAVGGAEGAAGVPDMAGVLGVPGADAAAGSAPYTTGATASDAASAMHSAPRRNMVALPTVLLVARLVAIANPKCMKSSMT